MLIRGFTVDDVPALAQVYWQTRRQAFTWLQPDAIQLADFSRDTEGERIWVADVQGQVVGFVSLWAADDFIHHLFVLPEFAGRGFGSRLLETCLDTIGRPARLKCVSENQRALRFYKARGWQMVSVGVSADGEYQLLQLVQTARPSCRALPMAVGQARAFNPTTL